MSETARSAVAEFVATFAVVLVSAGSVVLALNGELDLVGVALAYGLALAIMVSVTAHVSGGMVNPAVTIALWVTGRLAGAKAVACIAAQLLGAAAGAILLRYLVPAETYRAAFGGTPTLARNLAVGKGIIIEAVTTFLLVFAVFGTQVDERGPFAKTAGLTVGLVVAFDVLAFEPYTGAAMNPARWFGPALASGRWDHWYVWIVGPLAGAVIAGVLYWSAFLRDRQPSAT